MFYLCTNLKFVKQTRTHNIISEVNEVKQPMVSFKNICIKILVNKNFTFNSNAM